MAANNQVMLYVRRKKVDILRVETLLKSGSDVNAEHPKDGKCTALLYATKHPKINFRLIELLLKYGANIEAQNRADGKCTALLYAVRSLNINYEVIDLLLQNGADVNATHAYDGFSVLMYAIRNTNVKCEIIELLLRYKANINKKNEQDLHHTVLHYAVMNHDPNHKLIELLLENGAEINAKTFRENKTALIYSIRKPNVDYKLIKLLLKFNANPNGDGSIEGPPLPYLIKTSNFNLKLIKLLLENDAKVNVTNCHDGLKTPLLYAAKNPNCPYEIIELLLKHKANVNSINYVSNDSPLTYAVKHCNLKLVELFIKYKANIHQLTRDDYSAVVYAVRSPRINESRSETDESNQVDTDELDKYKIFNLLLKSAHNEHGRRYNGDCKSCLKAVKFVILEQARKNPSFVYSYYNCIANVYFLVLFQHFSDDALQEYMNNCRREIEKMKVDGIYPLLFPSPVIELSFSQTRTLIRRLISIWNDDSYPIYLEVLKSVLESKDLLDLLGRFRIRTSTSFKKTAPTSFLDWATTLVVVDYLSVEDMLHLAAAFFGVSGTAYDNEFFGLIPKRQRLM